MRGTAREPAAAELRRDICDQLLRMTMLLNSSRELEEPAASPLEARGPGSCGGFAFASQTGSVPGTLSSFLSAAAKKHSVAREFGLQESLVGGARPPPPHPFRLQCAALLLRSQRLPAAPLRTVCLPPVCLLRGRSSRFVRVLLMCSFVARAGVWRVRLRVVRVWHQRLQQRCQANVRIATLVAASVCV